MSSLELTINSLAFNLLPHLRGEVHSRLIKQALEKTGLENAWSAHQDQIKRSCRNSASAIVQILVPKEHVRSLAFLAKPYGAPIAGDASIDPENILEIAQKENTQARILLDPRLFGNPESGLKMNVVVWAKEQDLKELLEDLSSIVREIQMQNDDV